MYMINKFLTDYQKGDPHVTQLLGHYEVHIMPMVNPDGYEYSHTTDRMWRKNRNPNGGACVGVDLNRNYDYGWLTAGSSRNPCSDVYAVS
jgi:murein tripeptide amidase MpaA